MRFDLPLLRKELMERACSPRHYFERIAFALGVFGVFLVGVASFSVDATTPAFFGQGRVVFIWLYVVACAAVFLVFPAALAATIPDERERGSLDLLRVTDLSGVEIVLQKYLGRLVPFAIILSIACPAAAGLYAYGGLTVGTLGVAALSLGLLGLQVGALAIACSAGSASTGRALFRAYGAVALFYGIGPLIALSLKCRPGEAFAHVPITLFVEAADVGEVALAGRVLLVTATILVFLAASCFFLWRGRLTPRKSRRRARRLAKRKTRVANDAPVRWRELTRATWFSGRRSVTSALVVLAIYFVFCEHVSPFYFDLPAEVIVLNVWAIGVFVTTLYGLNAIAGERVHQTLDVLLTTPLSAREIVVQKAALLYRAMIWVAVVVGVITAIESAHWAQSASRSPAIHAGPWMTAALGNALGAVASVFAFLVPASWLGVWIGLRSRNRGRSAVAAVTIVAVAAFAPLLMVLVTKALVGWFLLVGAVALWWARQASRLRLGPRHTAIIGVGLIISVLFAMRGYETRGFFPWIVGTTPMAVAGGWGGPTPGTETLMTCAASMVFYFTWGLGLRFASQAAAPDALRGRK